MGYKTSDTMKAFIKNGFKYDHLRMYNLIYKSGSKNINFELIL